MTITPPGCQADVTLPYSVTVHALNSGDEIVLDGSVSLVQAPDIELYAPTDGSTLGSRTPLFHWRTIPATTGVLTILPVDPVGSAQVYTTALTTTHTVQIDEYPLDRNTIYQWAVEATSDCGTTTSITRTFTVGNGIVFQDPEMAVTIDRDYEQTMSVSVRNDDVLTHTLLATIENPYEDLIVNFVGSGSVDEEITLDAETAYTLGLSIHAADAELRDYELIARIVADEGGTPIEDSAIIDVHVLHSGDYTITLISEDSITGMRTFEVTNLGLPISDLDVQAVDPDTGEPARIFINPSVTHARLDTDESLTFQTIPLYDESDLNQEVSDIPFDLDTSGGGEDRIVGWSPSVNTGYVYKVVRTGVCMPIPIRSWYCTNRPNIDMSFWLPYFIDSDLVSSLSLGLSVNARSNVRPHSTDVSFNGTWIGGFVDQVPFGTYSFEVPDPGAVLNLAVAGPAEQTVSIDTEHLNGGHYVVATDMMVGIGFDSVTPYIRAESRNQADSLVDSLYGFSPLSSNGACSYYLIPVYSTWSSGNDLCVGATLNGTTEKVNGPINTLTGGYDYSVTDLSIPTSAGELSFRREYASLAVDTYTTTLGYGWTHSLDTRLIFPEDPNGVEGKVLFKVRSANLYEFNILGDGTFSAAPGVCGTLSQEEGSPVTYTFVDNAQRVFIFDAEGKITTLTEPDGNALHYEYDAGGNLERVSDDSGTRYIQLTYDAGRIASVSDHANRQVSFDYLNGNLISVTDFENQEWTYSYENASYPHYITEVIDPRETTIERTEYDAEGRAVKQYNGEGELVVELEYNGSGTTLVKDGLGNPETLSYGSSNALESQLNVLGAENTKAYDSNFHPTALTDPAGNTTTMTWSEDGANLESILDAEDNLTTLDYDAFNNLTGVTDSAVTPPPTPIPALC